MAEPCTARASLTQRLNEPWLLGLDSHAFWSLFQQRLSELQERPMSKVRILVADRDPVTFLASLFAACAAGQPVFLGNAGWSSSEWDEAVQCIQPDLIWTRETTSFPSPAETARAVDWLDEIPAPISIPTGGSSGKLRFAVHTWDTLLASVRGMQAHFDLQAIHSCCVLPLHHVSGLMQAVRSLTTGGMLAIAASKDLTTILVHMPQPEDSFLSLVPTQLQRCLEQPALLPQLRRFRAILLGGAPAWPALLAQARQACLPLALTYGMTETASQVATMHPSHFLSGAVHVGRSLPHAHIQIVDAPGHLQRPNQIGRIQIQAGSLTLGYYPGEMWRSRLFTTDDLGYLDSAGNLTVVGRRSTMIITGGENVHPTEVEAAILATGLVEDVCVIGQPDALWGEAVVAVYVPKTTLDSEQTLEGAIALRLRQQLSAFKLPKRWIAQSTLPRNAQGKLNRTELQRRLMNLAPTYANP